MKNNFGKLFLWVALAYVLAQSSREFHHVAWGTGKFIGRYAPSWGALLLLYLAFCGFVLLFTAGVLIQHPAAQRVTEFFLQLRTRLGFGRWILAFAILFLPAWFLQFTPWGVVFDGLYTRLTLWAWTVVVFAFLVSPAREPLGWLPLLTALILTSSQLIIAATLTDVTNYPFSLGWSEGNRLWDYSMLFASHLYEIPPGKTPVVLLDIGRQFIGGVPFLLPNLTIEMERLWVAITFTLPYIILGLAIFHHDRADTLTWLLATLWVFIFLKQGPIHPPLVLCAAAVALAWKKPLWLSIPIIAVATYFAWISRFTWMFAPGLWIGMLELAGAALQNKQIDKIGWARALSLGLTGFFAALASPYVFIALHNMPQAAVSLGNVDESVSQQPLLWYRLLPNATYGVGILAGMVIAVLPLATVLVYLNRAKRWNLNTWQSLAILGPLAAFLAVGLIVSAKIGGGGDLHNLDMFLIGLTFTAALAWYNGGREWIQDSRAVPSLMKIALILMLVIPAYSSLTALRSKLFSEDTAWLRVLADAPDEKSLGMLPPQAEVERALLKIQNAVDEAKVKGEVLFIDQRQLLTFGFIRNVPLIPEYEKKMLINEAMSENAEYFSAFYRDLATQKFSLIIVQPLNEKIQDSASHFGEENNAWVTWVSIPVRCYYKEADTMKAVGVQLLVPRNNIENCANQLPQGIQP